MQGTKKLLLLAGAAVSTAALALPADSHAYPSDCVVNLKTTVGDWPLWRDGSHPSSLLYQGGSNFDQDHGALTVNGVPYPDVAGGAECDFNQASTKIEYPSRVLDGLTVRRSISVVQDGIRRVDSITNTGNAIKNVDVDYALRVLGSQAIIDSESGDAEGETEDHWTVHENSGSSYPWLQWGETADQVFDPEVVSLGADTDDWKWENPMPDANLEYENISVEPGDTVRLVHLNGTGQTAAHSKARAQDVAAALEGLTLETAREVINYGLDPDKDGVTKGLDQCPGVKGNGSNGCQVFVFVPPPGGGDTGGGATPAPVPTPPAVPTPPPGTPGTTPPVADRTAPKITLTGLGSTIKRSTLTGKGVSAKLRCDETCRFSVKLRVKRRGAKRATTILSPKAAGSGTVKLKVARKALRRLSRQRVTVLVVATDAAGNTRTLTKNVKLS